MEQGKITSDLSQGVCRITFYHPAHNSLPESLLASLAKAIEDAGHDDDCQVIVLKGAGDRTFCAGASFGELMAIDDERSGKAFFMGFANVINACRTCPKPIIGRVHGKAIGGGVGLAAATDICFGTKYAAIKLSELAIGIGPFVVGPVVQRKIGSSAFSRLSLDARTWQNAYWARDKGLYAEVYESTQAMDDSIDKLADELKDSSPEACLALKKILWEGTEHWDELLEERAAISGKLVLSPFSRSAIEKFKSR